MLAILGFANRHSYIDRRVVGTLRRQSARIGREYVPDFHVEPENVASEAARSGQVHLLKRERERHDLTPLVVHDSYLINLASADPVIRQRSIEAFTGEIERALVIGAEYLVAHPGNYKDLTLEQGLLNVAEGLAKSWRALDGALQHGAKLTILLENTAGARNQIGGRFQGSATLRQLGSPYLDIPVGYCLDTCHCYVIGLRHLDRSRIGRAHSTKRTIHWGSTTFP